MEETHAEEDDALGEHREGAAEAEDVKEVGACPLVDDEERQREGGGRVGQGGWAECQGTVQEARWLTAPTLASTPLPWPYGGMVAEGCHRNCCQQHVK